MVELIAELRRHEFDVWIISASNVWSVRWMVTKALNPLLEAHGAASCIPADHVVGISALLQDKAGGLYKDALLVRENPAYAAMEESTLCSFRLTSRLQYPVPTYRREGRMYLGCGWPPPLLGGRRQPRRPRHALVQRAPPVDHAPGQTRLSAKGRGLHPAHREEGLDDSAGDWLGSLGFPHFLRCSAWSS